MAVAVKTIKMLCCGPVVILVVTFTNLLYWLADRLICFIMLLMAEHKWQHW